MGGVSIGAVPSEHVLWVEMGLQSLLSHRRNKVPAESETHAVTFIWLFKCGGQDLDELTSERT